MFGLTPTFSSQNEALEWLLQKAKKDGRKIDLPELKKFKWNGKDSIASHSKITSNIRKKLRKRGQDLLCYETHFLQGGRLVANHTKYEIVDRIYPKTKIISTQYL